MGYLQEEIARLRKLREKIGHLREDARTSEHPLVTMLAEMPESPAGQRATMIAHIRQMLHDHRNGRPNCHDDDVLDAMASIDRALFMPLHIAELAYLPAPFSIGYGQTISHPHIVALMTCAVARPSLDRVLDVGTGSGYQAAILSRLARRVVTVELIEPLAFLARKALAEAGCGNVDSIVGNACSSDILPHGQFDAIIVAARASAVPSILCDRLATGGRMVIPIGIEGEDQVLTLIERTGSGRLVRKSVGMARFVPLK